MTDRTTLLAEAARLTRAGRLGEATALIQRMIRGVPTPAAAATTAERILDEPVDTPGRLIDGSHADHAGRRAYKLYIPSGALTLDQTLPLVVMLHGCTQSPDDFAADTRMNELAEEYRCLVVYPAQSPAANKSKCWNWFRAADQRRGEGEPAIIAGITRRIMSTYPIDTRRVYVAGLSAGGAMAAVMGVNYPDLYAAVGVHSGLPYGAAYDLPSALAAMRHGHPPAAGTNAPSIPTIVFHGDRDTTVHPRNGDQVIAQQPQTLVQRGRVPGGHAYTCTLYLDAGGRTVSEQWLVHGAGHAWSGGRSGGMLTEPRGPDASREMVRFFYEHPRGD
jgi:poly(hydroxyalkanoate) depolymerase family esterase